MQQTFWLIGSNGDDTIKPANLERRNAICPKLFEANDLVRLGSRASSRASLFDNEEVRAYLIRSPHF